jgi:hypothetical protein
LQRVHLQQDASLIDPNGNVTEAFCKVGPLQERLVWLQTALFVRLKDIKYRLFITLIGDPSDTFFACSCIGLSDNICKFVVAMGIIWAYAS